MNIYVINYLFFAFSAFLLSILILLKRGDELARRWFYFSIVVSMWGVTYAFVCDNNLSDKTALFVARLAQADSALIAPTWFYFVIGFLSIKPRRIHLLPWIVGFFILATAPTNFYVSSVGSVKGFAHFTRPGPIMVVQFLNFSTIVAYAFYLMFRSYRLECSEEKRKEILSFILATIFGFIGGSSQFSLFFLGNAGIDATLLISTYPFIMAYVMIKHHVLDIEKLADAFQKEKLAAIGTLAASVNHELKSPLYVARGSLESYLQNLEEGIYQDTEVKEASKKTAETALRQLVRASEIMQKLTDFAKPNLETSHLEWGLIQSVLADVLELANAHFQDNKIRLNLALEEGLAILANRRHLEEVFFNLIVNACQAMKDGGELTIRAWQKNGKAQITIQDQGPGIASNKINRIFEPFYTTKESGTGLGLYVTKLLVQRNKGRILVESKPNKGTRFHLEFPASERQEQIYKTKGFAEASLRKGLVEAQ